MFRGEFTFDLDNAMNPQGARQYLAAYPVTNEPIEKWMRLTPVENPRVLTVAASGDQPLMYAAHGATHIDTFDITINACAVMDFKTTALQMHMRHNEYQRMVRTLGTPPRDRTLDWQFRSVLNNMPDRTRELMQHNINHRPYATCRDALYDPIYPATKNTYRHLQQAVTGPFNFIWADLIHVPMFIADRYDIIYLSNVLDHYLHQRDTRAILKTLYNLWPYLNNNGYILCTTGNTKVYRLFYFLCTLLKVLPIRAHIQPLPYSRPTGWQPIIIQKIR